MRQNSPWRGNDLVLQVTPGIRPAEDQKRITTPGNAIRDGAYYLVVAGPITALEHGPPSRRDNRPSDAGGV